MSCLCPPLSPSVVFMVCWTPGLVLLLLDVFCASCNVLTFEKYFLLLAVFSSAVNPIIYFCHFQELRDTFRWILCCSKCQEDVKGKAVESSDPSQSSSLKVEAGGGKHQHHHNDHSVV